jgi:hypothetical protein
MVVVAMCPILLSACSSMDSPVAQGSVRLGAVNSSGLRVTSPSAYRPRESLVDQQVLSAWLAAELAFHDAGLTANANEPALAATTLEPQLGVRRSFFEQMRASGEVGRGPTHYGTPTVSALVGHRATVRACAYDQEIVVYAATGRPVAGVSGQVDYVAYKSSMELTSSGWKLLTQGVATASKCEGT